VNKLTGASLIETSIAVKYVQDISFARRHDTLLGARIDRGAGLLALIPLWGHHRMY
jgi:hypothetical protein